MGPSGTVRLKTTASATTTHVYAAPGDYTATLKVTDDEGASDTVSHPVTVTNAAPEAAFGTTIDKLKVSANGGGSSDSDGTVASYDWTWGDGPTHDSGVNASHTYAAAGDYTVTLTVTDNDGSTGTVSHDVTVAAAEATPTLVASDDFGRTVSSGWGSADTGGAWTVAGTKANYNVSGGTGSIAMPTPGIGPSVNLAGVSSSSSDVQVSVAPQQMPTGSGSFVSVIGRQVAGVGTYRAVANLRSNGAVSLTIVRVDGAGQATVVPAAMVSGLTYAAGDKLNIRMQATGTSPTVLRAKVWKDGQAEPGWQLEWQRRGRCHAGCRIHRVDELSGGQRHCGDHEPVRHPPGLRHHRCCAGSSGAAAGCSPGEPAPERRRPAGEQAGLAIVSRAIRRIESVDDEDPLHLGLGTKRDHPLEQPARAGGWLRLDRGVAPDLATRSRPGAQLRMRVTPR